MTGNQVGVCKVIFLSLRCVNVTRFDYGGSVHYVWDVHV